MLIQTIHNIRYHTAKIGGIFIIEVYQTEIDLVLGLKNLYGIDLSCMKYETTNFNGVLSHIWTNKPLQLTNSPV